MPENFQEEQAEQTNVKKETSGLAVAALILGIIGFCTLLLAPIAIILGIVALSDIGKSKKEGKGLAITGLVLGCVGTFLIPIIAIIAAIAIPGLLQARIAANEGSTIGSLRTIATAQAQIQSNSNIDQDGDATGEYAFLQELAGSAMLRSKDRTANPPYISPRLTPSMDGIARKNGYCFYMYLPADMNFKTAMGEADMKTSKNPETVNAQEIRWICYAWPINYPETGRRVFVIDQSGEVFASNNEGGRYSGSNKPDFDSAWSNPEGQIQTGIGKDGQSWKPGY